MRLPNGYEAFFYNEAEAEQFCTEIFDKRIYTSQGINLCAGDVVFDVGANIGLFTLFAADVPGTAIYAFEPALDTFELLEKNVAHNEIGARCFNIGIGAQCEVRKFVYYPRASGMSSFYANQQEESESLRSAMQNTIMQSARYPDESRRELLSSLDDLIVRRLNRRALDCRIETISEIVRKTAVRRIDLLKIDVQKSELDVLLGIDNVHWPIILQLVIEIHDIGGRVERIRSLLVERGYAVSIVQDELYRSSCHHNLYATRQRHSRISPQVFSRAMRQRGYQSRRLKE